MKLIKGIGASKGIAIAKAYKIEELSLDIAKETKNIATEIKVFEDAIKKVASNIEKAINQVATQEQKEILGVHLNMVNDPYASESIVANIKENKVSAPYATKEFFEEMAITFAEMDDAYMRERAADVKDVMKKLLYVFANIQEPDLRAIK